MSTTLWGTLCASPRTRSSLTSTKHILLTRWRRPWSCLASKHNSNIVKSTCSNHGLLGLTHFYLFYRDSPVIQSTNLSSSLVYILANRYQFLGVVHSDLSSFYLWYLQTGRKGCHDVIEYDMVRMNACVRA